MAAKGGSFWSDGVYRDPRVWASGLGQQGVNDPRPLSNSVASLSMGTSHTMPRRQSREGFGAGLLKRK